MPGTTHDGHDFVDQALHAGAAVCVERIDVFEGLSPAILVENSVDACWRISKRVYGDPSVKLKAVGVTGTNGKTTVAWVLRQALESLGMKTAYMGTLGAFIGDERIDTGLTTPFPPEIQDFLRRCVSEGDAAVVMEVSSHALAQRRVDGVEFDVAVFTNLSQDHLDFHDDFEDYFDAKERLFTALPSTKRLTSVINADDAYGRLLIERVDGAITFGSDGSVKLVDEKPRLDRLSVKLRFAGQEHAIEAPLGARFNVSNSLAVFSTLLALGFSANDAARGLSHAKGAPGRFEAVPTSHDFVVIVDYAHTPDALEKVLQSARELTKGKLICVFGCGGDRDRSKRPKMAAAASSIADVVWVTSDNPRTENPESIIADILPGLVKGVDHHVQVDRRKAIRGAIKEASAGDCVVIAGKGHENYQIIGKEKTHFDDREVAAEALA
jgi:UDP-N-acetylmuramoyl-L-alanyl-D-glutamate--2,6-diaminopimelate ligase